MHGLSGMVVFVPASEGRLTVLGREEIGGGKKRKSMKNAVFRKIPGSSWGNAHP